MGDRLPRARIGSAARTRVQGHALDVMTTSYENLLLCLARRTS